MSKLFQSTYDIYGFALVKIVPFASYCLLLFSFFNGFFFTIERINIFFFLLIIHDFVGIVEEFSNNFLDVFDLG